ncbi:hypothetical protein JG687_00016020 [Phytophthora cactorum]|uniref:Uncharacterized protein n=1 Tax=Phytophthora cactorum TaxID=29920 RepID=A0A8T1TWC0_9STRA|nr:hypothetical protein GQ600_26915 [Phytophthora cactorum]KAG6947576.1 hypothetical protein JG687_00016020 [Phytophthora cactorum]
MPHPSCCVRVRLSYWLIEHYMVLVGKLPLVITAPWHQYTSLTSYFEGPLRYGEKPVVLQCEVAIYINRCYARAIRYCQVVLHKRNGLKSIEIREILRGEYDV